MIRNILCYFNFHKFNKYSGEYEYRTDDGILLHEVCFDCSNCDSFKKDYYYKSSSDKKGSWFGTKIWNIKKIK